MGEELLELAYEALLKVTRLQQLQDRIGIVMELSTLITDPSGRSIRKTITCTPFVQW